MIFETHAHYDDEKFDEDRAELLSSMQENGIGRIINVSAKPKMMTPIWPITIGIPKVKSAL